MGERGVSNPQSKDSIPAQSPEDTRVPPLSQATGIIPSLICIIKFKAYSPLTLLLVTIMLFPLKQRENGC